MPYLQVKGADKRFGAVVALKDADLDLERGEIHVLIGSNGSGKSTLCKIIAGSVIPDAGTLTIADRKVVIRKPRDAFQAGIGVFYQELSLVPQLSVQENLCLGKLPQTGIGFLDRQRLRQRAKVLVQRFAEVTGAGFTLDAPVSSLRNDQCQIVEVLKVLAADPTILIFDEPTSSLDKQQVIVFFNLLRELRDQGKAIIFISHRMDEIMEIGDRVTVLRDGQSIASLPLGDTDRDSLVKLMVGSRVAAVAKSEQTEAQDNAAAILTVDRLTGQRVTEVSFRLRRGEILGFGGLHGQGQSRVLRMLFGAEALFKGRLHLADGDTYPTKPAAAIGRGIAYISGDRGRDGVLLTRPIIENLSGALLTKQRRFFLSLPGLKRQVAPYVARLQIKFRDILAPISVLSGGNQQKTVIARWLATQPTVLLLDDPTKGIDLEAKSDLYATMRALADDGIAIILYSTEDAELLRIADRILVFNNGRITRRLTGEQMNAFNLYQAAYEAVA